MWWWRKNERTFPRLKAAKVRQHSAAWTVEHRVKMNPIACSVSQYDFEKFTRTETLSEQVLARRHAHWVGESDIRWSFKKESSWFWEKDRDHFVQDI